MGSDKKLDKRSIDLRIKLLSIVDSCRRGHIGSSLSLLEILRVLYDDILKYNASWPDWPDRDRFILSKGHGCLSLYMLLADKGFFPESELYKVCQYNAMLGGHPEFGLTPGIEASTGALGHGLSIGVGIAIAGKIDKKDYRTIVLAGDGECQEGTVWEAAMSASKHKLSNLTLIIDYNHMQAYGPIDEVQSIEPLADKWKAFGFTVFECDGHDVDALKALLSGDRFSKEGPNVVICHTIKGMGIPSIQDNPEWHHKSKISDDEIKALFAELGVTK
ncbi:MAG TPA: transketolase [Chitinispirillaceae bacterium]|nr:transketolase [Chitinispirillaceae bacterium]